MTPDIKAFQSLSWVNMQTGLTFEDVVRALGAVNPAYAELGNWSSTLAAPVPKSQPSQPMAKRRVMHLEEPIP